MFLIIVSLLIIALGTEEVAKTLIIIVVHKPDTQCQVWNINVVCNFLLQLKRYISFKKNRFLCAGKRKDGTKYKKFGESKIIRINIYQTTNKNLDSAPDLEI